MLYSFTTDLISTVASLGLLIAAVWAFIDCLTRPAPAFPAVGRFSKPIWLGILGACVVVAILFSPLGLFGLAALVASLVYLLDVRQRVAEIGPRR